MRIWCDRWLKAQHQWVILQRKRPILDVEDAEKILFIKDIKDVQAAAFQMQRFENILG